MKAKYMLWIEGYKTGFNAHSFEGTLGFTKQEDADAAFDFKIDSAAVDPELTMKITKLYGDKATRQNRGC